MKIPVILTAILLIGIFCIPLPGSPPVLIKGSPGVPISHASDDKYEEYLGNSTGFYEEWIQNRRFLWQHPNFSPPST